MTNWVWGVAFLVAYVVLTQWLLPKLGVSSASIRRSRLSMPLGQLPPRAAGPSQLAYIGPARRLPDRGSGSGSCCLASGVRTHIRDLPSTPANPALHDADNRFHCAIEWSTAS